MLRHSREYVPSKFAVEYALKLKYMSLVYIYVAVVYPEFVGSFDMGGLTKCYTQGSSNIFSPTSFW